MNQYRTGRPRSGQTAGERIFGLDFGKYLLSSSHQYRMESDLTGESDISDWEQRYRGVSSDFSEDSDEYGIYYSDGMYDTAVDSGAQHRLASQREDRQANKQMRKIITQLNAPTCDPGLYPIREGSSGSGVNESSGSATYNEDDENSDDIVSNSGSPLHKPVYGRYQKLLSQGEEFYDGEEEVVENLMLHRLPGENLGMILGIEGGKDEGTTVSSVMVKSVTLGGAAYRASGGSKGVCAGDDIVEVNGQDLLSLSHDECISIFKDMPLQVLLGVQRGQKNLPPVSVSPVPLKQHEIPEKRSRLPQQPVRKLRRQDLSDSEEESFGGFAVYQVTVDKEPDENLGLSIVPSYGSTKEYYQIKRILPSGAAAQSGQLSVGDRLILCNGTSLRGLPQSKCLAIIRSASSKGSVNFEVIRPVYNGSPMEISVTVNSNANGRLPGFDPLQYSLKSQSYDRNVDVIVTSESEDYLTVSEDEYSKKRLANIPEVEANEVFATNSVKLAYQKPIATIEEESTETETDPENNPESTNDNEIEIVKTAISIQNSKLASPVPSTDLDNISVGSGHKSLPKTDIDTISLRTNSPTSPRSPVLPSPYRVDNSYLKRQQVPVDESERTVSPPPEVFDEEFHASSIDDLNTTKYNPLYSDSSHSEQTSDAEASPAIYTQSPYNSASQSQTVPFSDLDHIVSKGSDDREVPRTQIDSFDGESDDILEAEEALPPPVEFSDNQFGELSEDDIYIDKNDEDSVYFPVTNIDDIRSEGAHSAEGSPDHKPHNRFQTTIHVDSDLAFNSELTAPFDSVLQEQLECVQNTREDSIDKTETNDGYDSDDIIITQFEPKISKTASNYHKSAPHRTVISVDTNMDQNSESMLKNALDMEYEKMPESGKMQTRVDLSVKMNGEKIEFDRPELENNENVAAEMIAKDMVRTENGNYGYYMESDDEPDQFPEADGPEAPPALPMSPPPNMVGFPNGTPFSNNSETPAHSNEYNHITERPEELLVQESNWSFKAKSQESEPPSIEDVEIVPVTKSKKVDIPINILEAKVAQNFQDEDIVPMKVERNFELPSTFKKVDNVERQIAAPDDEIIEESKQVVTKSPRSPAEKGRKVPPVVAPKPKKNKTTLSVEPTDDEPAVEEVMEAVIVDKDKTKNLVNVISVVNALKNKAQDKDPDVVDVIMKQEKVRDTMTPWMKINGQKEEVTTQRNPETFPPKHEQIMSEADTIKVSVNKEPAQVVNVTTTVKKNSPRELPQVAPKPRQTKSSPRKDESKSMTKDLQMDEAPPIPSAPIPEKVEQTVKVDVVKPVLSPRDTPKPAPRVSPRTPTSPQAIVNIPVMKTSITVEKSEPAADTAPKTEITVSKSEPPTDRAPNLPSSSPPQKKEDPIVPPLNLRDVTTDESKSKSPKEDQKPKPDSSSPKTTSYKTTIGVKPGSAPAPTSTIKPLSQIKPLSFNPKSLSQSMKPVQYKTSILTNSLSSSLGRPSLSSTLATSKSDHPIKRMETMPFEVSILKGILGLGIKTTMTQDGLVQVTEILPSGPVGREGNIKVGDYLLSINNTSLIGLTDSKVQQILRLLPRGLSKIVASPVKPDAAQGGATVPETATPAPEKFKLSPRQSAPSLSSSTKQPTVITAPKPPTFPAPFKREVKPIVVSTTKSVSPHVSPRTQTDAPAEVVAHAEVTAPAEPQYPASQSPISSPRQQSPSPKASPRSPPPVAPKPKRPTNTDQATEIPADPTGPIETEIFVSVNASTNSSSPQDNSGPHLLPGSVNYDSVQTVNKTDWTPGVVSSSDIKAKDMVVGKSDVVDGEESMTSPITIENTVNSPCEEQESSPEPSIETDTYRAIAVETVEAVVNSTSEQPEDIDSGVSDSLYTNRSRTFSTSSSHSSYTDFHECNVEDDIIPEQIVEEEESPDFKIETLSKDTKDDDYESDFEEEQHINRAEPAIVQPVEDMSEENLDAVKQVAENIVSNVISEVMKMDLSEVKGTKDNVEAMTEDKGTESNCPAESLEITEVEIAMNEDNNTEVCFEMKLPAVTELGVAGDETPPSLPDIPPPPPTPVGGPPTSVVDLPTEDQFIADTVTVVESSPSSQQNLPGSVVDMNLYPDDSAEDLNEAASVDDASVDAIDVQIDVAQTVSLHESAPNSFVESGLTNNETDFTSEQVIDNTRDQSGEKEEQDSIQPQVEVGGGNDEQSYSVVLSMYSDLEKSLGADEVNAPVKIIVPNDNRDDAKDESIVSEQSEASIDIKTVGIESDMNVSDLDKNANETKVNTKQQSDKNTNNAVEITKVNIEQQNQDKINTDCDGVFKAKPANLILSDSGRSSSQSDEVATPSPRRVDDILQEMEQSSPVGKYSPETERMIRVMSVDEEPANNGEGEIIQVSMTKGVTGVGFVIQGGKMSPKGDLPISIKRIFKGGPADGVLQVRDEILEVDGEELTDMRHSEAWSHLKFLPSGQITMKIKRYESSA